MVTNNDAVDNFLNGKRNLAAYQFSQLIKQTTSAGSAQNAPSGASSQAEAVAGQPQSSASLSMSLDQQTSETNKNDPDVSPSSSSTTTTTTATTNNPIIAQNNSTNNKQQPSNSDEIAFNYAMINLFTGCPQRASVIFSDLVKRYPRNPRLWLRLAESMLAAERAKMTEFEHIQQTSYPHSGDHIKTKNKPILIKINPNYCEQQIQQKFHLQKETAPDFLVTIRGYLQKSLELINEYNDISLLTDDIPNPPPETQQQNSNFGNSISSSVASTSSPTVTSNSVLTDHSSSPVMVETSVPKLSQQLSYANPYQSISRADLYHLRNKVQLNLAYVCLCMGEYNKALNYTTQCLKTAPSGYEKLLASLYHAEACILIGRIEEAIQLLNVELLNIAKSLPQEHSVTTSANKKVVYGDDMHRQLETNALATVVTYNMSVAYAAMGEMSIAQKILMRSAHPTKPHPMQITICLLYIQLQLGQLESAKRTILNNLPQFR